jgi:hypothetical protein
MEYAVSRFPGHTSGGSIASLQSAREPFIMLPQAVAEVAVATVVVLLP